MTAGVYHFKHDLPNAMQRKYECSTTTFLETIV